MKACETAEDYLYELSVIMAVYNVEPFLREAIESLVNQMIGFDKIQLIMVDDGSTDESGKICDEYAKKYPDNIIVIHKENGGVSSARNKGLQYATGRYVNFMDSDDKLTPNVALRVVQFFETRRELIDVVAIPLYFFDGARGQHPLNAKFKKGSRIIDLYREPSSIHLSMSSSFIKLECLQNIQFDTNLAFAEDAKILLPILAKKGTLGVLSNARYYYRKRSTGELSAIQKSQTVSEWYMPYLEHFQEATIRYFLDEYGYLPKFVQYTLAYDLQWRIKQTEVPETLFSNEEVTAYKEKLINLISMIDDDVWLNQKSLWQEHKLWALKKKYGHDPEIVDRFNERFLRFNNTNLYYYTNCQFTIEFIELREDCCVIEGYTGLHPLESSSLQIHVEVNGLLQPCQLCFRQNPLTSLGEEVLHYYGFICNIPLNKAHDSYRIRFFIEINKHLVEKRNLVYKKYSPIGTEYKNSFYTHAGWTIKPSGNWIIINLSSRLNMIRDEIAFCRELWKKKGEGTRKAVFVRFAAHLINAIKRKEIWLICDKADRADDNGEAFFTYIRNIRPSQIRPYFLLSRNSTDWKRVSKIGKVVSYMSAKHKLLYLISDYIISAYSHDEINNPFIGYHASYRDLLQKCQYIFLQHGIIKDDLSIGLNRGHKNIKGFITSTRRERDSIIQTKTYLYSPDTIWLTGLPRYDYLYHNEERAIVIMPTWRRNLFGSYHSEDSRWELHDNFKESDYYKFYNSLLNDSRLIEACKRYNYNINFVPHPTFFPYVNQFSVNSSVKLWGAEVRYRDMFAKNMLLITDYSSVAFDFAYLRKPVIYAHFDSNHYAEGYFDYERDGFGEVLYSLDSTIDTIIEYLETNCQLKGIYRDRIDSFFAFNDRNCCQRVFDKIIELRERSS